MLLGRYNSAFKHFSKAYPLYKRDSTLKISGLIKNIAEVYKQLEMYREAAKYY